MLWAAVPQVTVLPACCPEKQRWNKWKSWQGLVHVGFWSCWTSISLVSLGDYICNTVVGWFVHVRGSKENLRWLKPPTIGPLQWLREIGSIFRDGSTASNQTWHRRNHPWRYPLLFIGPRHLNFSSQVRLYSRSIFRPSSSTLSLMKDLSSWFEVGFPNFYCLSSVSQLGPRHPLGVSPIFHPFWDKPAFVTNMFGDGKHTTESRNPLWIYLKQKPLKPGDSFLFKSS